jgi:hypothetical protein
MKNIMISSLILLLGVASSVEASQEKNRQRLDELFLWKLSESLNLKPQEEASLRKVMKDIKDERAKRTADVDETLKLMQVEKTPAKRAELLTQYRSRLMRLNESQVEELDQLEKILGAERMPEYILAKEKLVDRIKDALADSSRDKKLKSKVQNPKIIEQK